MHPALAAHLGHHANHVTVPGWAIGVIVLILLIFAVPIMSSRESRAERNARARVRHAEDQMLRTYRRGD